MTFCTHNAFGFKCEVRPFQQILQEMCPGATLESDVEKLLHEMSNDFMQTVMKNSCKIAQHRKSSVCELDDLMLYLKYNLNFEPSCVMEDEYFIDKNLYRNVDYILPPKLPDRSSTDLHEKLSTNSDGKPHLSTIPKTGVVSSSMSFATSETKVEAEGNLQMHGLQKANHQKTRTKKVNLDPFSSSKTNFESNKNEKTFPCKANNHKRSKKFQVLHNKFKQCGKAYIASSASTSSQTTLRTKKNENFQKETNNHKLSKKFKILHEKFKKFDEARIAAVSASKSSEVNKYDHTNISCKKSAVSQQLESLKKIFFSSAKNHQSHSSSAEFEETSIKFPNTFLDSSEVNTNPEKKESIKTSDEISESPLAKSNKIQVITSKQHYQNVTEKQDASLRPKIFKDETSRATNFPCDPTVKSDIEQSAGSSKNNIDAKSEVKNKSVANPLLPSPSALEHLTETYQIVAQISESSSRELMNFGHGPKSLEDNSSKALSGQDLAKSKAALEKTQNGITKGKKSKNIANSRQCTDDTLNYNVHCCNAAASKKDFVSESVKQKLQVEDERRSRARRKRHAENKSIRERTTKNMKGEEQKKVTQAGENVRKMAPKNQTHSSIILTTNLNESPMDTKTDLCNTVSNTLDFEQKEICARTNILSPKLSGNTSCNANDFYTYEKGIKLKQCHVKIMRNKVLPQNQTQTPSSKILAHHLNASTVDTKTDLCNTVSNTLDFEQKGICAKKNILLPKLSENPSYDANSICTSEKGIKLKQCQVNIMRNKVLDAAVLAKKLVLDVNAVMMKSVRYDMPSVVQNSYISQQGKRRAYNLKKAKTNTSTSRCGSSSTLNFTDSKLNTSTERTHGAPPKKRIKRS